MNTQAALENAREAMDTHGLEGWEVVIDARPLRRLGQTRYSAQEIGLSKAFVELNPWPVVEQTVLHEMAHAMCGPGTGHGPVWKRQARALGVLNPRSRRLVSDEHYPAIPQGRILVVCPIHGPVMRRARMPKAGTRYRHNTCGRVVTFARV